MAIDGSGMSSKEYIHELEGRIVAHALMLSLVIGALEVADGKIFGQLRNILLERAAEYKARSEKEDNAELRIELAAASSEMERTLTLATSSGRPTLSVITGGKGDDDEA